MIPPATPTYAGDLSLRRLVQISREAWGTNPICIRLWMVSRKWVRLIVLLSMVSGSLGVIQVALGQDGGVLGPTETTALMAVSSLLSLILFAVWIVAPFMYPVWAWRTTWRDDPMLRLADLPFRDRLIGIFVPFLAAYCAATAFSVIVVPIGSLYLNDQFTGAAEGSSSSILSSIFAVGSGLTSVASSIFTFVMASVAIGIRRIVNEADPAGARARGFSYIIGFTINIIAAFIVFGILRAVPIFFMALSGIVSAMMTASSGGTPAAGGSISTQFAGVGHNVFVMLVDVLTVFMIHRLLVRAWRTDIPLVHAVAFEGADAMMPAPEMRPHSAAPPPMSPA